MAKKLTINDGGTPCTGAGLYVVYVNDDVPNARFAARTILMWDGECWYYPSSDQRYRDYVYGFIGPLPPMQLKD